MREAVHEARVAGVGAYSKGRERGEMGKSEVDRDAVGTLGGGRFRTQWALETGWGQGNRSCQQGASLP